MRANHHWHSATFCRVPVEQVQVLFIDEERHPVPVIQAADIELPSGLVAATMHPAGKQDRNTEQAQHAADTVTGIAGLADDHQAVVRAWAAVEVFVVLRQDLVGHLRIEGHLRLDADLPTAGVHGEDVEACSLGIASPIGLLVHRLDEGRAQLGLRLDRCPFEHVDSLAAISRQ